MPQYGNAVYGDDGSLEIFGNEQGLPQATAVIPCPWADETERQKRFEDALESLVLKGYFIIETKRIRNEAFDKKNEKTTLEVKYRACKSEQEIHAVASKIKEVVMRNGFIPKDIADNKVAIQKLTVGGCERNVGQNI